MAIGFSFRCALNIVMDPYAHCQHSLPFFHLVKNHFSPLHIFLSPLPPVSQQKNLDSQLTINIEGKNSFNFLPPNLKHLSQTYRHLKLIMQHILFLSFFLGNCFLRSHCLIAPPTSLCIFKLSPSTNFFLYVTHMQMCKTHHQV